MSKPLITIIIATFNSQRTLGLTLKSISKQTISPNKFEILIVDGGSKDKTLKIARSYKTRIIKNPMVDALNAKYLGFLRARGKYIIGLDHDEVFKNKDSLERRLNVFESDKRVKSLHSSGYITPKGSSPINFYVNEFGDPFSFFIYRLTKDFRFFIDSLRNDYQIVYEDSNYLLIKISTRDRPPLMELLAGGGMFDRNYVIKNFKNLISEKKLFLPHLHIHLLSKNPHIAVMKNDPLYHFSAENFNKYLKKLDWRIKNNIYFYNSIGSAGFLKRGELEKKNAKLKKLFFIPYSFSIVLPLLDALWLSLTRVNLFYLIHLPLSIWTSILIVYHYIRMTLGLYPYLTSYDGSRKILKPWR